MNDIEQNCYANEQEDEKHCYICGSKENLYGIYGKEIFICHDCLDDSDTYGKCFTCEKYDKQIAYDYGYLREGDDGNFYCREHSDNGDDEPSEDAMDLIEKFSKD